MARDDEIRTIAYYIWQEDGCVHGHDCEHWIRAEAIWEDQRRQQPAAKTEIAGPRKSPQKKQKTSAKKPRSR
jgi:hypothetical protein